MFIQFYFDFPRINFRLKYYSPIGFNFFFLIRFDMFRWIAIDHHTTTQYISTNSNVAESESFWLKLHTGNHSQMNNGFFLFKIGGELRENQQKVAARAGWTSTTYSAVHLGSWKPYHFHTISPNSNEHMSITNSINPFLIILMFYFKLCISTGHASCI